MQSRQQASLGRIVVAKPDPAAAEMLNPMEEPLKQQSEAYFQYDQKAPGGLYRQTQTGMRALPWILIIYLVFSLLLPKRN